MTPTQKARAFIVEDEGVVLLDLELILVDLGYDVVARACDIEAGLALAREIEFDVAILDLNLAGRSSGPIADVLADRGIPFVFASGYTRDGLPEPHINRPLVSKPYCPKTLQAALKRVLMEVPQGPPAGRGSYSA